MAKAKVATKAKTAQKPKAKTKPTLKTSKKAIDLTKLDREGIFQLVRDRFGFVISEAFKFAASNFDHDTVALVIGMIVSNFVGKSTTRRVIVGALVAQIVRKTLKETLSKK